MSKENQFEENPMIPDGGDASPTPEEIIEDMDSADAAEAVETAEQETEAADTDAENEAETETAADESADGAENADASASGKKKKPELTPEEKAAKKEIRKENVKRSFTNKSFKNGSFSILFIVVAFAGVILINLLVQTLPSKYTEIDVSGNLIYGIGEETEETIANLDKDVELIVLAAEDDVDERINTFISKYEGLSDHISIQYIDPVKNPTILSSYEVAESCIVVNCPDTGKNQIVYFSDMIVSELDYYSYMYYGETNYTETEFDGESQITCAIVAVTNPTTHKIYCTEGHEETALGTTVTDKLEKMSVTTETINLSTIEAIPEDCEVLLLNGPAYDLTDDETELLSDYLANGGEVVLVAAYNQDFDYDNLNKICEYYGISINAGYLGDASNNYYYTSGGRSYYFDLLFKVNGDSDIASDLSSQYVFLENALPLTKVADMRSSVTVESILHGSEMGFAYVDESSMENVAYDTYYMGLESTETVEDKTSRLVVFSCQYMVDETLLSSFGSNICNADLFVNELTSDFDDVVNLSIDSKSLEVEYNTFSFTDAASVVNVIYAVAYMVIIPIALFVAGLVIWLVRRKK